MKKLILLGIVLGLLALGDLWVKGYAERRVAAELQSSFDEAGEAEVELSGFPITVRLFMGTIPSARVTSSSLERQGVRFTDVRLTMQDVEFSLSQLAAGNLASVTIRDGHGRVSVPASELTSAFAAVVDGLALELDENRLRVRFGPLRGTAELSLDGTDLVLRIPKLERDFRIDLPRFVDGLEYRSIRVTGGEVVLQLSLKGSSFSEL